MVSPLISALLGAGEQYMADEDASDKLKGDIIDGVSSQIYEVEIPEAQKQINNIKKIKIAMREKYGQGVAEAFDNIGLYESGDQRLVDEEIRKYFVNLKDTKNISQDAFEKSINELFEKTKLAGEEGQEASRLFKGRFGGQSMLALKTQQLDDRKSKVRELFNDRSNVRDLIVAPDAPKEGVRGFLFGDRITAQDVPGATGRLTEATQVNVPEPAEAAPRVPFSALGLGQEGVTDLREYDKKEDESELRRIRQDFDNNVTERILRDKKPFEVVFPQFAEDYNNAVKVGGYKGTKQDYYKERYIKQQFKLQNINYTSRVDKVDAKTKKLIEAGEERVKDSDFQFTTEPTVTGDERSSAFAFAEDTTMLDYAMEVEAINISLSNAIAKILRNPTLDENQREIEIERVKKAAREKLNKLGPAPKDFGTGAMAP